MHTPHPLKATLLATAIALGVGSAGAVAADDRTATEAVGDAAITAAVKAALLADTRTEGFDIDVDTHAGVVTLNGGADSIADKVAASKVAFSVSGVAAVDNRLVVAAEGTAVRTAANTATASGAVRGGIEDLDGDGVDEVGPGPDAELNNVQDLDGDGIDEVGPGPDAELNNVQDLDGDGVDEVGPGPDAELNNVQDLDGDGVDEVGPGPDAQLINVQDLDGDGVDEVGPGPDAPVNDVVGTAADPVLDADDVDTDGQAVTDNDADLDTDVDADARIDGSADLNAGTGAGASAAARASGDATATAWTDGPVSDPTPRTLRDTDGDGVDEVGPGPDADTPTDSDGDGVDEVDDANDLLGDTVDDDRLGDGTGGPSDAVDDAWITAKVKSQLLADPVVEGLEIDVDTNANVVTLTGRVETAAQRDAAIRIATATQGVHHVDADALTIGQ